MAEELTTLERVDLYCDSKEAEKTLNKDIKALNEKIKQEMRNGNMTEMQTDKYVVTLESRVTDEIDPALMLMALKKYWDKEHAEEQCPFIRTVEVIDEDALEKFMYSNKLPEETMSELEKCRKKKVTTALTYKKVKGSK